MKNISQKSIFHIGTVQIHVDSPTITLIKSDLDLKMQRFCMKIKLYRNPLSEYSNMYEFKMALFYKGDTDSFLLFLQKIKMVL